MSEAILEVAEALRDLHRIGACRVKGNGPAAAVIEALAELGIPHQYRHFYDYTEIELVEPEEG